MNKCHHCKKGEGVRLYAAVWFCADCVKAGNQLLYEARGSSDGFGYPVETVLRDPATQPQPVQE